MAWDKKLMLAMVLFISFIVTMGIAMIWRTNETPEENYYEKDLVFEENMQAKKNAIQMDVIPHIQHEADNNLVVITFPKSIIDKTLDANIYFQRPNNKKMDFKIPLVLDTKYTKNISTVSIEKGIWNIWIKGKINHLPIQTSIKKINIK